MKYSRHDNLTQHFKSLTESMALAAITCLLVFGMAVGEAHGSRATCKKHEKKCETPDGNRYGDCDESGFCGDDCEKGDQCKEKCVKWETIKIQIDVDDQGNPIYDPVLPGNGAYVDGGVDLLFERGGLVITSRRSYYSKSNSGDNGVGHKWDHSLLAHIEDLGPNGVILHKGGGPKRIEIADGEYKTGGDFTLEKVGGKFELTQPNGFKYYFDSNNNIVSKVSPVGQYYNWVYDGNQNVATVQYGGTTDVFALSWDHTNQQLTKVTNVVTNATVSYEYSLAGDLTKVTSACHTCAGAKPRSYQYDAAHLITAIYNADGVKLHDNQYDSSGRVTKQVFQTLPEKSYEYDYTDFASGLLKITKPDSVEDWYYMDSANRGTRIVAKNAGMMGADVVTDQYYDDNDNLTRHVHGNGVDRRFLHDAENRMTAAIYYDATNPITVSRYEYNENGNFTRFTDAEGVATDYLYDENGLLTKKVVDPTGANLEETWVYDAQGQKITQTKTDGTVTSFDYDANGYLITQAVDPSGLAIKKIFWPDAVGRTTKMTDIYGNDWHTLYNAGGKITKTIDPSGRTTALVYDGRLNLVSKIEQDADVSPSLVRTYTFAYDEHDRLTRMTDPANRHTDYAYDLLHRRVSLTQPTGEQRSYAYNELGKLYQEYVYDGTNWVTVATYEYDGNENLTRQTNALGAVEVAAVYDVYNRLSLQIDGSSNVTEFYRDGVGRMTRAVMDTSLGSPVAESRIQFDGAGRVTRGRQLASPGGSISTTNDRLIDVAYSDGRTASVTRLVAGTDSSPVNIVETVVYDAAGRRITLSRSGSPSIAFDYDGSRVTRQAVDPGGLNIVTTKQYDAVGRLTRTVKADGVAEARFYDGLGRLTRSDVYDDSSNRIRVSGFMVDNALGAMTKAFQVADPASRTSYSALDDPETALIFSSNGLLSQQVDEAGNAMTFTYDSLGRQVTVTDADGNTTSIVYDDAGRLITKVQENQVGVSTVTYRTVQEWDDHNRITRAVTQGPDADIATSADNRSVSYAYDALGRITRTAYNNGRESYQFHDAFGNVTRTQEDAGTGGIARTTDKLYDRGGRLTRSTYYTDGTTGAQHTDHEYDLTGTLTRITYPDDAVGDRGYIERFADAIGRVTRMVDQAGQATDIVYDQVGRRLTVTRGSQVDSFAYNALGGVESAKRGTTANLDAVSAVTYLYDDLNRMTAESQSIRESTARTVSHTLNDRGLPTSTAYPNGNTVDRVFDAVGRLTSIDYESQAVADYTYNGTMIDSISYGVGGDGLDLDAGYDGAGMLTRMQWSSGMADVADLTYEYDAIGAVTSQTYGHRTGDPVRTYERDSLGRLTRHLNGHLSGDPYEAYIYDDLGNRLTFDDNGTANAFAYNAANELTSSGGSAVDYDTTGNLTKNEDGYTFLYDRQNQLTMIQKSNGTEDVAAFAYDALGRRIEKTDYSGPSPTVLRFYYDGEHVVEETDDATTPSVLRNYVWGNGTDELLLLDDGTDQYVSVHDRQLSPLAFVKQSDGTVAERYEYGGYGSVRVLEANYTDDPDGVSDIGNPYGYTGRRVDVLDGGDLTLLYSRTRYYDAQRGRWLQRDSVGYVDGGSLYTPYHILHSGIDPYGTSSEPGWTDTETKNCSTIKKDWDLKPPDKIKSPWIPLGFAGLKGRLTVEIKPFNLEVSGERCECCDKDTGETKHVYKGSVKASNSVSVELEIGWHVEKKIWKLKFSAFAGGFVNVTLSASGSGSLEWDRCKPDFSLTVSLDGEGSATIGLRLRGQVSWRGEVRARVLGEVSGTGKVHSTTSISCNLDTCKIRSGIELVGSVQARALIYVDLWWFEFEHEWSVTHKISTGKITVPELEFDNPFT